MSPFKGGRGREREREQGREREREREDIIIMCNLYLEEFTKVSQLPLVIKISKVSN